jgi:hypothetical protein
MRLRTLLGDHPCTAALKDASRWTSGLGCRLTEQIVLNDGTEAARRARRGG